MCIRDSATFECTYCGAQVAAKRHHTLKLEREGESSSREILLDMEAISKLAHPRLVPVVAVVLDKLDGVRAPAWILYEWVGGYALERPMRADPPYQPLQEMEPVSYTHLRAHETPEHLVCRLLLEKKKNIP
eukprot:TRINITY_DN63488_c0_g1_i1.p2 TRINITY_DN63488_c0_g1~~TRINITY_DN63488_c0_g1_i1.p2  ORF type:complete len:131 (+),score=42.63 TRINITY_DN63488_c0_g1_i1:116-508(+)